MRAERRTERREVGIDVQHPAVVVPEHAHPVGAHPADRAGGVQPPRHVAPHLGILQPPGDERIPHAGAVEHAGDLRHAARLAVLQPDAGHHAAVADRVERGVVQLRHGLDVQDHHERALGNGGQDGRGERVRGDEEEHHVDVGVREQPGRRTRLVGRVDKPRVHHLALLREALPDLCVVAQQVVAQSLELRPIGIQPDAEKTDFRFHLHSSCFNLRHCQPRGNDILHGHGYYLIHRAAGQVSISLYHQIAARAGVSPSDETVNVSSPGPSRRTTAMALPKKSG